MHHGVRSGNRHPVCLHARRYSRQRISLAITATTTNFQLATTTAPAGRLAWLMGTRPDAITNLVELESLPLVQHGYTFNYSGAAAFYRAAFIDTNITNTLTAPLAIGTFHAVAITTNGNIQSWGDNSLGQFGNGLPTTGMVSYAGCWVVTTGYTNASEGPLVQSSARHWSCVAAGDNCTLAVETNGSLWAWGDDTYGSLGVSTNGWPSSWSATPVAIGTNALWRSVFAYGDSSFAIRRDGTLWAWGDNTSSVLGVGTNFSSSNIVWFPTQVGNSSNWVSVFCLPNSHSVGIQTDGLLWAWGQTDLPTSVRAGYADTNDLLLAAVACPGLVNIPDRGSRRGQIQTAANLFFCAAMARSGSQPPMRRLPPVGGSIMLFGRTNIPILPASITC